MDPYFWEPWRGSPPERIATAACRHGDHRIEQLPSGTWVDADGFTLCLKTSLDSIGQDGIQVLHEPMPEGPIGGCLDD